MNLITKHTWLLFNEGFTGKDLSVRIIIKCYFDVPCLLLFKSSQFYQLQVRSLYKGRMDRKKYFPFLALCYRGNSIIRFHMCFRGYQQQDAHEFMRYLLDRLHTELLTLLPYPNSSSPYIGPKGKSTIVTTIFGGILQNEVKCLMCGIESKKHDPFLGEWKVFQNKFAHIF